MRHWISDGFDTTLHAKNLEVLSAERLAQLLIEVGTGNAAAKLKHRLAQSQPNDGSR